MTSIRSIRKRGQRLTQDGIRIRKVEAYIERLPAMMVEAALKRVNDAYVRVISKAASDINEMKAMLEAAALESLKEIAHEIHHPSRS